MKIFALIQSGLKYSAAVVAFLLTIEMCARIDDALRYDAPLWKNYTADCLRSSDSEGVPYNVPYARFQKWQNNGYGFRGPEILPAKPPGTIRVICLGASESYGLHESPGKEWPAQLRSLLPDSKYQVVNVSVVGLGLGSYEAYMKKYVLKLDPDLVICFVNPLIHASECEQNKEPRMPIRETGVRTVSTGQPRMPIQKTGVSTTSKMPVSVIRNSIAHSRCFPKVKQVVKQAVQDAFPDMLKWYQVRNLQKQINAAELARLGGHKPEDTVPASSVIRFGNDLSRFVSFLEARKIKVVLGTYPALISGDNISHYPVLFLDNRRFSIRLSIRGMLDTLEKYNSTIRTVAASKGAMLADCQAVIPKTEHYFGDNVHYTDSGARLVAEHVAGSILGTSTLTALAPRERDVR